MTSPMADSPTVPLRIGRLALGVQVLSIMGLALMLVYLGQLFITPTLLHKALRSDMPQLLTHMPSQAETLGLMWLAVLLPVGVSLWALTLLYRLFGRYRQGRVFDLASVGLLQHFGHSLWLLALARPLSHTLQVLAFTWENPPGQRQLAVGLSTDHYTLLLLGLVLVAISRVMLESVRLARENAEFV